MLNLPIAILAYKVNSSDTVAVTSRSFFKNQYLITKLKERYSKILLNETGSKLQDENHISKYADLELIQRSPLNDFELRSQQELNTRITEHHDDLVKKLMRTIKW